MTKENEIVLFETDDKKISLNVSVEDETVWLTQSQMVELFQRDVSVISRHIRNVFKEGELEEKSNLHFLQIANSDKPVAFYSLDVIISVGYRVKSNRGVEFRRWANSVLKQYILQGYAVNQKRIQQLSEVIRIMKRTENELDSKQILSVIERYNNALDLLDAYDHQTMKRPKGNEAMYVLAYEECVEVCKYR
ncbi:MAG: virulence RhuM family protein [Lachnospiraceae bacterium]|nr:virulence RhuM family protein [Lachnospiraceae bacterium]